MPGRRKTSNQEESPGRHTAKKKLRARVLPAELTRQAAAPKEGKLQQVPRNADLSVLFSHASTKIAMIDIM
jgi:hypothetical protein